MDVVKNMPKILLQLMLYTHSLGVHCSVILLPESEPFSAQCTGSQHLEQRIEQEPEVKW